nr:ABC transporter permease [Clostridium aestuarii]
MLFFIFIPIFLLNRFLKIKVNKNIIYSTSRMIIQLSLVGIYLQYLFNFNNVILNLFYVIIMVVAASFSIIKSCKLKIKNFISPVFFAVIIPHFFMIMYFNYFVAKINNIFDAKYLITIGGMLLGNCLSGNIIGLNSFYNTIKENEKEYFYSLGLGASRLQALNPYFKKAILSSINPTLASMATIGLVALPGMMTGQILGGSIPVVAIKYQIAIMIAVFVTRYFSIILVLIFSINKCFDDYDVLNKDVFLN